MKRIKTLANYIDESGVKVTGAQSASNARSERMKAIVIDDRPLGSYEIDMEYDKEGSKRFSEYQWVAISLVGCDADLELKEIRSLKPRHGKATPDFEATTRKGDVVRIELCRLIDEDEMKLWGAFGKIFPDVQKCVDEASGNGLNGEFLVRIYREGDIQGSDVASATEQLARFIKTDQRLQAVSDILHAAGPEYPTLHRLEVRVAHRDAKGRARVVFDPDVLQSDTKKGMELLLENFDCKKVKYVDYSDGYPVWLVFIAQSYSQRFISLSLVNSLRDNDTFDSRPFDRVLLGCYTAGVTFEKPFAKPRYTSLTTTG